jgi:hypothetical protein
MCVSSGFQLRFEHENSNWKARFRNRENLSSINRSE